MASNDLFPAMQVQCAAFEELPVISTDPPSLLLAATTLVRVLNAGTRRRIIAQLATE
jgi:hypothetical protein